MSLQRWRGWQLRISAGSRCFTTVSAIRSRPRTGFLATDIPQWRLPMALVAPVISVRGAKRTSKVRVADLPQGLVGEAPSGEDGASQNGSEEPTYPTVIQQAKSNMKKFENCVLLTRVGGFYELYFEQAEQYGPLLGIKVARKRTNAGPVPMAGFPFIQLDRYLKMLLKDLNTRVAVSEEFANNPSGRVKSGGLLFDRRVVRVITPGTLIDEQFINPFENNYILAVCAQTSSVDRVDGKDSEIDSSAEVGLAWLDLSTGDFYTQAVAPKTLSSVVARIGPREIIMNDTPDVRLQEDVKSLYNEYKHICSCHQPELTSPKLSNWSSMLEDNAENLEEADFTNAEIKAGTSVLHYVQTQLQGLKMRFQPPVKRQETDVMAIDKHSLRALEIKSTLRDGAFKGSLLHAIRNTVTSSGARLLSNWLVSPSASLAVIEHRLDLVSFFFRKPVVREDVVQQLRRSYDCQRLVQKFSLGRGDTDDLVALSKTIQATHSLSQILTSSLNDEQSSRADDVTAERSPGQEAASIKSILDRFVLDGPMALADRIAEAVDEESLSQMNRIAEDQEVEMASVARGIAYSEGSEEDVASLPKKGANKASNGSKPSKVRDSEYEEPWLMRTNASPTLAKLHTRLEDLENDREVLEEELRSRLGASSLTLRWTPGLGHICHLKGKDSTSPGSSATQIRSVGSSRTTRSFHMPEWTDLGGRIDQTKLQIRSEEQRVFVSLRDEAVRNLVKLRRNAAVLDELDIASSFATSAQSQGLVRPILNHGTTHKLVGARHPMVEIGLYEQARNFVNNDCFVGDKERIWLITGPNMAGKSTFLRQNALISIMAQIGSFVPAEYAEMGLVDAIFSRIGAADNLYEGQSTFMVEMLETAAILQKATPRSFVIMDEVGRGTTPEDGIAVSYACLHHLHYINKCRTLFATHFHALTEMTSGMDHLACYCTDLVEGPDGAFSYVHRLRKGVNRKSHALKVAKLAGLPPAAIELASEALHNLRN